MMLLTPRNTVPVCVALALLWAGAPAQRAMAASFDCAKATTGIEKAICGDAALSDLDEYLGRYYGAALAGLPDGAACLKLDQKQWITKVRDACGPQAACLKTAYLARLATLDGLQPGASALKDVELPNEPVLLAAIPPEADVPPASSSQPFEAMGHLVHQSADANNMGYAVKPATGQVTAFVYDMSIGNSASHEAVRGLIEQEPDANFLVRGTMGDEGGFSEGQCRYVYRLN
jgi:uncharacterized protein